MTSLPDPARHPILLYDGVCNLCDRTVQFVLKRDRLGQFRFAPLQSGVGRALAERYGFDVAAVDTVVLLLIVALLSLAAGGVYQQRFCAGVDFRATAALQNVIALVPVAVLATVMPETVADPWKAAGAVAAVVLLNATLCMTLYVRAINHFGAAAVAMLFTVIPAVAGLLSWLMLGQRPDIGIAIGLLVGAAACWLNARVSRQQRQNDPAGDGRRQHGIDPVHDSAVTG